MAEESWALYSLVFGSDVVSMFSTVQKKGLVSKMSICASEGGGQFPRKLFDVFS